MWLSQVLQFPEVTAAVGDTDAKRFAGLAMLSEEGESGRPLET